MRTVRVYSHIELQPETTVSLTGDAARHIAKVLRMRMGDLLIVFDGRGTDYTARIANISRSTVQLAIGGAAPSLPEAPVHITLWHGVCKGSRMDYVVQKATELGVSRVQPVLVERSVVRLDDERALKKIQHWQNVAISAAEQSGRSVVPRLAAPQSLEQCLREKEVATAGLMLHPGTHPCLTQELTGTDPLILFTGPEGGFTDGECAAAAEAGFRMVSLGPRILRSETAPVAALAIVQAVLGDLR